MIVSLEDLLPENPPVRQFFSRRFFPGTLHSVIYVPNILADYPPVTSFHEDLIITSLLVKPHLRETQNENWPIRNFEPVSVLLLSTLEAHIRTTGEFWSLVKVILIYSKNKNDEKNAACRINYYWLTRSLNTSLAAVSTGSIINYKLMLLIKRRKSLVEHSGSGLFERNVSTRTTTKKQNKKWSQKVLLM